VIDGAQERSEEGHTDLIMVGLNVCWRDEQPAPESDNRLIRHQNLRTGTSGTKQMFDTQQKSAAAVYKMAKLARLYVLFLTLVKRPCDNLTLMYYRIRDTTMISSSYKALTREHRQM
jgi:hypothetical protein